LIKLDANAKLRELLYNKNCYNVATIFNPLSVRIAEQVGFNVGIIPGKIISLDYLAEPDLMLLSLTELTETVRRIAKYAKIPLIVDGDNGYGNAINVCRAIESLEDAGASGISLEDTVLPIKYGKTKNPDFLSIKEATLKIKLAVDSKLNDSTSIIARTGVYPYHGISDLLQRGKSYESVGADALFYVNINSENDIEKIAKSHKVPIILGNNSTQLSLKELSEMGVSISLPGHNAYYIAMEAYRSSLDNLYKTGKFGDFNIDIDYINKLSNEEKYSKIIKKYM
jgi:carboxyvinyl-carboxyphosphonate phosphorylmutase|tara:strand:- start:859 stop:1707 length:849 start_codon:yes stop_codon:yes gene_type:complete